MQRTTSARSIERILQRVTSDFLQRATSATNKDKLLQRVTSDFTMNNQPRVKTYVSMELKQKKTKMSQNKRIFEISNQKLI